MLERLRFERELSDLLEIGRDSHEVGLSPLQVKLPLLLAGPIVRRATREAVWFWFASSKEVKHCTPSVTAYGPDGRVQTQLVDPKLQEIPLLAGDRRSVRLGENIWINLVSAVPQSETFPTDVVLGYELSIVTEDERASIINTLANLNLKLTYPPFRRPTFVIGNQNRRLAHGSCRRPGAVAHDAFIVFDEWLAKNASHPLARPGSLFLTGDQIYADDVAVPLFTALRGLALDVFGYVEQVPKPTGEGLVSVDSYSSKSTHSLWSGRRKLTHRKTSPIGFTTEDGEAHLISFPEYAAMYLVVWNPELCAAYGVERGSPTALETTALKGFARAVEACRRVMANIATYMLCDDHEITDDWNLDKEWENATTGNRLARRIISNGLAAYWAFQAWGNDPNTFDQKGFIDVLVRYFEQLRTSKGYPRSIGSRSPYDAVGQYEKLLLGAHWSFMAASSPKALCIDTRTKRETPKRKLIPFNLVNAKRWLVETANKTAILSGARVQPYLNTLLRKHRFRRGDSLLLVTPTPFLPHRSMLVAQAQTYKFPQDRYEGDYELYSNNPGQRAEFILWLRKEFGPSSLVFFSGDVHHGSVVPGRYAYGPSLAKIRSGKADWAMRVIQITSSPIKNEKDIAYRDRHLMGAFLTDAGNVGETIVPQWEHQYASTKGGYIAMSTTVAKLKGNLGRQTYIFEPHLCVVDMPSMPKGDVKVLFIGPDQSGKPQTADFSVDTDSDPAKFVTAQVGFHHIPVY